MIWTTYDGLQGGQKLENKHLLHLVPKASKFYGHTIKQILERVDSAEEFSENILWIPEDKIWKAKHGLKVIVATIVVVMMSTSAVAAVGGGSVDVGGAVLIIHSPLLFCKY